VLQWLDVRGVNRHHRVEQEREVDALGLDRQLESIAVSLRRNNAFPPEPPVKRNLVKR